MRIVAPEQCKRQNEALRCSVVLTLDGDSYRLRGHHARADTLCAATTGTRQQLR